jgi:hypothetical protein
MNNICTTVLMGGLGNLLFQIAHAYTYSLRFNKSFELYKNLYQKAHHTEISEYSNNLFNNIHLKDSSVDMLSSSYVYREQNFGYREINEIAGNVIFHGYFQSYKYIEEFKPELLQLFNIKDIQQNHNTCSIHVRRGDYVSLPDHHPLQTIEYYQNAINKIGKSNKFHVFSDDIDWCKNNFSSFDADLIYSSNKTATEDFQDMLTCENHIIANSTFSWWPAWIINNRVIAPNKWFGNFYKNYNQSDLIPKEWTLI